MPGTRLGPYEILAPLSDGMGEAYKASDTRLNRIITIKVSSEQLSERFEGEAHAVAALNHSHLLFCHGGAKSRIPQSRRSGMPCLRFCAPRLMLNT